MKSNDAVLRRTMACARYEFVMQRRRPAVWILTACATLISIATILSSNIGQLQSQVRFIAPTALAATFIQQIGFFLPVTFGLLFADRLDRDKRFRVQEVLEPAGRSAGPAVWGKFLGCSGATAVALSLGYLAAIAAIAFSLNDLPLLPASAPVILIVVFPGLALVAAAAMLCTRFLPVPLFSALFVAYWYWGNVLPANRVPTISCTPLTPIGKFASVGFFKARGADRCGLTQHLVSPLLGLESILMLLGLAVVCLLLLQLRMSLDRQLGRQQPQAGGSR
jgi:ABC-2 type transport system permease protein